MQTLERITVTGFKSIRELRDFKLQRLNVLVGANGAGKTNFISLFKFLNNLIERRLQVFVAQSGGAEVFLHFGRKVTDQIYIDLEFVSGRLCSGYQVKLLPSAKANLIFDGENCSLHRLDEFQEKLDYEYEVPRGSVGGGYEESRMIEDGRPITFLAWQMLERCKVYHFHDTGESARIKQIGDIADNSILKPDAANLAAYLYLLKHKFPDHYRQIVSTVRLVAPFFDDFVLRALPENENKIRLEWREQGSDNYFDSSYFSDGTLRFICLATLLLQPQLPSLVIIDEPELGLHPYAINVLADLLSAAATKTQVLVSTQSVSLVNQFQPEDIIVVDRMGAESVFSRLDSAGLEDWLAEYSLGELWEKNVIGGRP